jgi:membrane-associated phospholipid phosphatase
MAVQEQRRRWRRLDPDARLGLRLTLAMLAVFLVAVPFLLLMLLVLGNWSPLRALDTNVADGLHLVALRNDPMVDVLSVVSDVFDPLVFRALATVLAVWLWLRGRRRLAAWAFVTTWGSALLGMAVKAAVGRSRPSFVDAVAHAPGRSFPSGHALGSMVGCGVLLLVLLAFVPRAWRWLAWLAAAVIVGSVGFARVGLGVHYVSDVVAGWVLGLGWLAATTAAFQTWRREEGAPRTSASEGLEPDITDGDAVGRGVRRDRAG